MAFTRFYDDDCRIQKYLEETTNIGNYNINVPGNGLELDFYNDPHIRMQKWGANLSKNKTDLESDLFCMSRKLNNDEIKNNDYKANINNNNLYNQNFYNNNNTTITDETRVSHPAYLIKEINYNTTKNIPNNFNYLLMNPQEHVCRMFENNISTRIVEKDYYTLNKNN